MLLVTFIKIGDAIRNNRTIKFHLITHIMRIFKAGFIDILSGFYTIYKINIQYLYNSNAGRYLMLNNNNI